MSDWSCCDVSWSAATRRKRAETRKAAIIFLRQICALLRLEDALALFGYPPCRRGTRKCTCIMFASVTVTNNIRRASHAYERDLSIARSRLLPVARSALLALCSGMPISVICFNFASSTLDLRGGLLESEPLGVPQKSQ